ncbi:hypothetical protein KQX54_007348 [Cotesia glomerata]|uniref:Uncharacterized protein n=1 Tax=Cotesia glomerata TaxID=32391 RepID=A0AAV7HVE3_COTGL|nr:hypothetical protein KQX54_007348 [Cotesia glomerata]
MNVNARPFFRQGRFYEFIGCVREIFGYREFLYTDHFFFGIYDDVVKVSGVCLYGRSFNVSQDYSPFEFRVFSFAGFNPTHLFYNSRSRTMERRVEAEMDVDD